MYIPKTLFVDLSLDMIHFSDTLNIKPDNYGERFNNNSLEVVGN